MYYRRDLDEDQAQILSRKLISLYANCHADAPIVSQKLATDLGIFYMQPNSSSHNCVSNIAAALAMGTNHQNGTAAPETNLTTSLHHLSGTQQFALLKFVNALAEEGTKRLANTGSDRKQAAAYEDRIESNINDAAEVMYFCLDTKAEEGNHIRTQAVNCLAAWAFFCQKAIAVQLDQISRLRTLIRPALRFAATSSDDVAADLVPPLDIIADMLSAYPAFFKVEHLQDVSELIRSSVGQQYMSSLQDGDVDAMPFVRLLCAYVDADLTRIVEAPDDSSMRQIMGECVILGSYPTLTEAEMMHQLLHCYGYAAVEDYIIVEMLGIWNTFVEFIADTTTSDVGTESDQQWHAPAKAHIIRMVEEFWAKIQYPPLETYQEWPEDDKKVFQQFRNDVRDLLNTCHLTLSNQLLQAFVHMALAALEQQHWTQLEAALFSLCGVAESLDESEEEEAITAQLMNSPLYPMLTNADPSIPLHVRRTAMKLIGNLGSYFERRPESLPNALNYLFTSLAAASMAESASRSIYDLCNTCRESLEPQLEDFFHSYQQFLSWPTATTFTKSRVIGAVAAIAQTVPTDVAKAECLTRLLDFVEVDVRSALELMAHGQSEQSASAGIDAMTCLSLIAKSFQELMEIVDLDSSGEVETYWTDGDGAVVQQRIIRLLSTMLDILGPDIEVMEAVCNTLKAGFSETSPGPFVLQPSVVVQIITRPQAESQHLCHILNAACGFVRAYTPAMTKPINDEVEALLNHLVNLIQQLGDPRADPEVSQSIVEVLARYMPRYTSVLIQGRPETTLTFVLACMKVPEPLLKRAAATFWSTLLTLTSQPQPLQGLLDEVVTHYGPALARAFVYEIAYNSMRTDLEMLADPLKKLWSRHLRSRSWFEEALNISAEEAKRSQDMGLQIVAAAPVQVKSRFLEQMKVARDLASVRKAMQEFSMACKAAARN